MAEFDEEVQIGERYILKDGKLLNSDGTEASVKYKPGVGEEDPDDRVGEKEPEKDGESQDAKDNPATT